MPKKPSKASQTPKRPRSGKKRSNRSNSPANSASNANSAGTEKKHVSPLVAALVLLPAIGGLLYLGTILIGEVNKPINDDPIDQLAGENDVGGDRETNVSADYGSIEVANDTVWKTEESYMEDWNSVDDASEDGWSTEHFTNQATSQFKLVKKLLKHPEDISVAAVGKFADESITVGRLRPAEFAPAFADDLVTVNRAADSDDQSANSSSGHQALAEALAEFASHYSESENLRIKIKVFRVENGDQGTKSRQTVEVFGQSETGLIEENLTWVASWKDGDDQNNPKLTSLVFDEYERVEKAGQTIFSDCTGSVVGHSEQFQQQMMRGFNYWLERGQFREYYVLPSNSGVTIADVNNDGLEDVFVCQEMGLPCLLYLQQKDGSLLDFSKESNLDVLQNCRMSLIVDWNNDGNNDVALAVTGGVVMASGDGTGRFTIETVLKSSVDTLVLSAADYDLDGRLDLFTGAYRADLADWQTNEVPGAGVGGAVNATDGGKNMLFHNRGDWNFVESNDAVGMNKDNFRYTQAASWEDFDNDGDPDLYIANDFGFNMLFRNDLQDDGSRTFVDITSQAQVQDQAAGMSAAWGDHDRDGWMDLYVSNMYSYAGNRIAFQDKFKSNRSDDVKGSYQRFARGNTFFRNPGKAATETGESPAFQDLSLEAAVNRARWAWGARFFDVNNDGWDDLIVGNGYITSEGTGDL